MIPPRSEVFARTYEGYLQQIQKIDVFAKADILGLERRNSSLVIPVYNSEYIFSHSQLKRGDGQEISIPVQVIICKYLLTCPLDPGPVPHKLQPFRDFKNAAPLVSHFTNTTTRLLECTFSGRVEELRQRCHNIGGEIQDSEVYDLSCLFYALPRIPLLLNYNDRDELFPANCSILFHLSAARYLDMECLSMTGTLLADLLCHKIVD
ncbi:DUF3786 domain-containing protein [Desulforhopalus sp. IMCC35007]|uniref:DUF3786 domain-containing protein n=1 Tax=Desulforhopalus sp. IMCC35007 TaxID=2569543 RepID=UPI0010AE5DD7|nr:DUF3786 domain-containing protein [Desulforhopalus sp. IMCC35007]TKB07978.1 DUF3786 domain-containing protein [Desulforhopalus sp. IMCC35007]